jgi:hypothetical protein
MNIFQPPTDSLYKFMAVAGLLILGFSMIWPELRLYELEKQTVQLMGEVNILKIETDHLKESTPILVRDTSAIETTTETAKGHGRATKAETTPGTTREQLGRKAQTEELTEKNHLLQIKLEQIRTKAELGRLATTDTKRVNRVLYMGVILGLVLSLFGFILWYRKVQRWQDIAARRQAVPGTNGATENKTDEEGFREKPKVT